MQSVAPILIREGSELALTGRLPCIAGKTTTPENKDRTVHTAVIQGGMF